jgi:hypothetical protein
MLISDLRKGIRDAFTFALFMKRTMALVIHLIRIRPATRTTIARMNFMPYLIISAYILSKIAWIFSMMIES